jgi:hypothetical protein
MPDFDTNSEPDFGTMNNATVDSRLRQDDYSTNSLEPVRKPMC